MKMGLQPSGGSGFAASAIVWALESLSALASSDIIRVDRPEPG